MGRLTDKRALITGGAGGIGEATAIRMSAEGAVVCVTDVDDERGERVCDEIKERGGDVMYLHLDVRDEGQWGPVLKRASDRMGRIDVLANIAAVCALAPISETTYEKWRWHLQVDLDGKFFGCKHALPYLSESGRGSIVNVSSSTVYEGAPGSTAYSAAKGGVLAFSKALAAECAQANNGVRVNCVIPGPIETLIWVKMRHGGVLPSPDEVDYETVLEKQANGAASSSLVHRAGRPADMASAITYLASDEAGYVNGTDFIVDGGRYIAAR